jgi:GNAT superfamily N-acetyltransferase
MRGPSFEIRRAASTDAVSIAHVHVDSWHTTYPGIVDQAYIDSLSVTERAAAWGRRLSVDEPSGPDTLVATADGSVVGFISGGLIREPFPGFDAELHAIYLLAAFQGHGLGRRLVREWATLAVARGLDAAVVRVLTENPARLFYERLGAVPLRDAELRIGERLYPERWYGWPSLADLTAS